VPEFGIEDQPALQGLIVTATTVGSVLGTVVASRLADSAGRRGTMLMSSALFVSAGIALCWAPTAALLILARFVIGVAIGNAGSVVPVYIAECAEKSSRGALSTIPQLFISTGILISYVVSLCISIVGAGQWRIMTGFTLLPALVQTCLCLFFLPESPRWLLRKGDRIHARKALARLRGTRRLEEAEPELIEIERGLELEKSAEGGDEMSGFASLWRDPSLRRSVALCVTLQMLQQWSGINAIVYYTPQTLKEVGVPLLFETLGFNPDASSLIATILAYVPKIPSLLLTMALMDRVGRRRLLQVFVPLMGVCHFALAASFSYMTTSAILPRLVAVASICMYGCAFALSLGPIPNILTAELFPLKARSSGMAVSLGAQFFFNTLVGMGFPVLRHKLGTHTVFAGFGGVCLIAWLFINRFVPETKGASLEGLSSKFEKPKDK